MNSAVTRGQSLNFRSVSATIASLSLAIALATPALAQVPSMLGAPGLSPVGPATQPAPASPMALPPAVAAPPELNAPPAEAAELSSCDAGMINVQKRRNAAMTSLNALTAGGKNKKLDPVAACPRLRTLVAAETEIKNWMVKNKDWCAIPDQVIEDMKKNFARTPTFANQACNFAAQMAKNKRLQAQQAGQVRTAGPGAPPAVKLPSGPL